MRINRLLAGALLALVMAAVSDPAMGQAQGKGQAKAQAKTQEKAQGKGPGQAPGQTQRVQPPGQPRAQPTVPGQSRAAGARAAAPGQARSAAAARGRFARPITLNDVPSSVRQFVSGNRTPQTVAAGALARAHARGAENEFRLVPSGNRISVLNRQGDVLLLLDEDRARNLGRWDVNVLSPQLSSGAPSFCRSGAGHPVWGRQWCMDKGFGLGDYRDVRWGRTTTVGDIIFGRTTAAGNLAGDALSGLIGTTAFDRLALHAMTLGYAAPLTGVWATEASGRRVLLVNSGPAPVAEIVDVNSDNRADLLLVALRPWL
ncbi:hypothetical protein BH23GEM2_BH23GEM2_02820 [soil metagenome]